MKPIKNVYLSINRSDTNNWVHIRILSGYQAVLNAIDLRNLKDAVTE